MEFWFSLLLLAIKFDQEKRKVLDSDLEQAKFRDDLVVRELESCVCTTI